MEDPAALPAAPLSREEGWEVDTTCQGFIPCVTGGHYTPRRERREVRGRVIREPKARSLGQGSIPEGRWGEVGEVKGGVGR